MTEAENRLCDWQSGRSGSFVEALFELMAKADGENLARLRAGFPEEVDVFMRYRTEENYWPALLKEYHA